MFKKLEDAYPGQVVVKDSHDVQGSEFKYTIVDVECHKEEEVLNMCEATKQWEEEIGRRNTNNIINMMGVRKEGVENIAPEEAIERLKLKEKTEGEAKGKAEGILEGRENEKIEIAEKMKEKGYSTKEIEELTGILLH